MMHVLKAAAIAFSMYSKIPVPQFEWREKDLRYMLCFFPLVGVAIGACEFLWLWLCDVYHAGNIFRTAVFCVIPVLITGGIHADGFMDVADALSSHKSREKKLEILKDPHIGAFAVIMFAVLAALFAGAFSQTSNGAAIYVVIIGFVFSRALSGFGAVTFKKARRDGTLYTFADAAKASDGESKPGRAPSVRLILFSECIACALLMIAVSPVYGSVAAAAAFLTVVYYYFKTKKEFGGITGDTAGYFLCICECAIVVTVSAAGMILK